MKLPENTQDHKELTDFVNTNWEMLQSAEIIEDILPGGSPDRVPYRTVLQDAQSERWVLEGFLGGQREKRNQQAAMLNSLMANGCTGIAPWLQTKDGDYSKECNGIFWQLRKYIDGTELPRENYGEDGWRGETTARFIEQMRHSAGSIISLSEPFRCHKYIHGLLHWIAQRNKALEKDLQQIHNELEGFLQIEEQLPLAFCHGDLHPLNILWGNNAINGVIDWEFWGIKTELYDVANIVGCIGMDSPEWLMKGMAHALIEQLKRAEIFSQASWHWLPELIVAQRFGWMREWCAKQQNDMIIQELDFMWLILDNRETIRNQ